MRRKKMKIIVFDGHTINPGDLSWAPLESFGQVTVYDATAPEDARQRLGEAEVLITSKCPVTREFMAQCPNLKYIGSTATGYNNIDVKGAASLGIAVTNIPAYSTDAVAQHTIALILEITNNVALHNISVKKGEWENNKYFCYWKKPVSLLAGKSLGIIGYGQIGKKVGEIAKALGMTINPYSQNEEAAIKSDFLTLHCPLTEENTHFVNEEFIGKMKENGVLINTARGNLICQDALAKALKSGKLRAAALDVLEHEPPEPGNPLIPLENCFITPHMAWAPKEMRESIIRILGENLDSFLNGEELNRVDKQVGFKIVR